MSGQQPWVVGVLLGATIFLCGLADTVRSGTLDAAQGADAPAYVRIATGLLEKGTLKMPGPDVLEASPQERPGDVFGSPWSMTVDGRLLPKHPVLFGATLVPGIAIAGVTGARITALLLGALLGGVVTAAATRRFGAASAVVASLAVFVLSPAGRNVLWAINVDTMITVLWFAALVLADTGRPFPAGLLGGLLLFLRPPAILLLAGVAVVASGRTRQDVRLFAAGLAPLLIVLAVVNTVWWGSPWASSYDRVAILSDAGLVLATHSSQFTLPPWEGLRILLFHGDGGLFATAPVGLLGLLGLLLPGRRDRLSVAATASATCFLLLLSGYTFLARVPETAYRFTLPLLAGSVLPLAALLRTALDLYTRRVRPGAAPSRSQPDGNYPPVLAGQPLSHGRPRGLLRNPSSSPSARTDALWNGGAGREPAILQPMRQSVILVPTFNERDNVEAMCTGILSLGLDVDLLFVDDKSPDGTGDMLNRLAATNPRITVLHRPGKLGVGGAHRDGILLAYERGCETLITMDCDFTHSPADIRRLVENSADHDVTVGSRFLAEGSLPGWNPFRRTLTLFGHFLTTRLLGIPYDATGAFRVYRLSRIPRRVFEMVTSSGYAFFFESLFLLSRNGISIGEVPIVLPARTYGHSKMSSREALRSLGRILELASARLRDPGRFVLPPAPPDVDPGLVDPQNWAEYWQERQTGASSIYSRLASVYRRLVIRPGLNRAIRRHVPAGSRLLHAGCGSGEVDRDLQYEMALTAVDISPQALALYVKNNPGAADVRHASILSLPFRDGTFDGVYNLGVMEHFDAAAVGTILSELRRVLKPGGKVVLFWPHARGTSVALLGAVHYVLNDLLRRRVRLHPPEVSLLASRSHAEDLLRRAGLEPVGYSFGPLDGFVQAIVVGRRAS